MLWEYLVRTPICVDSSNFELNLKDSDPSAPMQRGPLVPYCQLQPPIWTKEIPIAPRAWASRRRVGTRQASL